MSLYDLARKKISLEIKRDTRAGVPVHSLWGAGSLEEVSTLLGLGKNERIDFLRQYKDHVWIYVCTFDVSEAAASVPWKLFSKSNPEEEITSHPLLDLFQKPNLHTSFHDFKFASFAYLELYGNNYVYLVGNGTGPVSRSNLPQSAFILIPNRVGIKRGQTRLIDSYSYAVDANSVKFEPEEILHSKYFNPLDEVLGQSTIDALKFTLLEDRHAKEFKSSFFKNSLVPSGVFSTSENLSNNQFDRARKQIEDRYVGKGKSHKPMILEGGAKWQNITMSPKDVEFINQYKINREEILSAFGEPPTIAGIEGANYAESKVYEQIFWTNTIIPKVNQLIATYNTFVCPLYGDDIFLQADTSGIQALHETLLDTSEMLNKLTDKLITRNEGRRILSNQFGFNLPKFGPEADVLTMPLNVQPISEAGGE